MRYEILSPKYLHVLGIALHLAIMFSLGFVLKEVVLSNQFEIALFISFILAIDVAWLFFFTNKFVYAKIDLKDNLLLYGNFFFDQEIATKNVKFLGSTFFFKKIFKIQIGSKKYYINSIIKDVKNYLE